MIKNEGRLAGILGAIIIHLIAGIIFMSFQLKSLKNNINRSYIIELEQEPQLQPKENPEKKPETLEKILQDDPEMLNIAKNLASKSDQKINEADYVDKVKEELIKSGKLGKDNFIDEKKEESSKEGDEKLAYNRDSTSGKNNSKPSESQKMASNYKGPTRIYYYLKGRTHTYLPIPIYMCEGSGKIVLSIEVNQRGLVEKAKVITEESTTSDPCLIETATRTALDSRFNPDINSPGIETGTLTYIFVAQ
jgi:outer membrane biosynthesis protein TonB